jgi:hypothetical protein
MLTRIRRLDLDGLRLFRDEGLETGGPDAGPDLHVVVGDSGTGKTTLCHGLRLALYGTTPWVSAANVSLPLHEATDGPATATVSAAIERGDARYRVERTLTEETPDGQGDATVGPPRVERWCGGAWTAVDDPSASARRLAPPETEAILVNDPGLQRAAGPAGWAPVAQGLLTAAAAGRSAHEDDAVTPADLWDRFRRRVHAYVDIVGPAPGYEVTLDDAPFGVTVSAAEASDGPTTEGAGTPTRGLPTGESIRLGLAMTLAAGDCGMLPQWFDVPFGRLDGDATGRAIEGFEAAAERRQVVLLPHQGTFAAWPELRRNARTAHRLEPVADHRATISDPEPS